MSDQADNPKSLQLEFTSETTQQLKAAVDSAVANGEALSVSLTVSEEAHAALVAQLSSGAPVAAALIHSVPPTPLPEPEPEDPNAPSEDDGDGDSDDEPL